MNPDGNWQTPDDSESSAYCPVNATEVMAQAQSVDADSKADLGITSYEDSLISARFEGQVFVVSGIQVNVSAWIILGASKNIRISANDGDDNASVYAWIKGFGYSR